jgi:dTDP-L-rhamnose 4-epimerase
MKVLVTGGAGFIGSHLVDELRERDATVIAIDSLDPGVHRSVPSYLRSDVEYCFADLRYLEFDNRFEDVEAVVHLAALGGVTRAAREPANIIEANAGGTARLIAASRNWPQLKRILLVSSFSVYGANYRYRCSNCGNEQDASRRPEDLEMNRFEVYCQNCRSACAVLPIGESSNPNPLETYGASKYMQELCLRGITHCAAGMVRLSSVYGTRLRLDDGEATIIAKLAGWIRSGVTPQLFEDGRQLRDWVYVGDVVATLLAMLENPAAPAIVNVCSGLGTSLLEASVILSKVIGVSCRPDIVGGFRPGDMRHCLGDTTRMRALIGRDPLPFSEGAKLAFSELATQPMATVPA